MKIRFGTTSLFWLQILCAFVFAGSQAIRMLGSVEGVRLSFFLCHTSFALILLILGIAAFKGATTTGDRKIKRQGIAIYAMWVVLVAIHTAIAIANGALWNRKDTTTLVIVLVGSGVVVIVGSFKRLPLSDAYVKAGLAAFFKCVPQVALAFSIVDEGAGGLSGIWILMGHVTILIRLEHLRHSLVQGHDRNTVAQFWSEVGNEASWLVATLAWITH